MANVACLDFVEEDYSKGLNGFVAALQCLSTLKNPCDEFANALERNAQRAFAAMHNKERAVAAPPDVTSTGFEEGSVSANVKAGDIEFNGLEFFIMI